MTFFLAYLCVGIGVFRDYGAGWDEPINRDLGQRTARYVGSRFSAHPIPWSEISDGMIAQQGPLFETILAAGERSLGLEDPRSVFLFRHLATFLAFYLGSISFYALLRLRFADWRISLLGVALLVLTPRLFAHSFYNSKDVVLTALFMVGALTMLQFLRKLTIGRAILHALACAAAVSLRVVGLLLPVVTIVLLAVQLGRRGAGGKEIRRAVLLSTLHLFSLAIFIGLFWPALWEHPGKGFMAALAKLSAAPQQENPFSLYFGRFVRVDQLPWHYLPVWIGITIPVSYLGFFLAGMIRIGRNLARGSLSSDKGLRDLAVVLLFCGPILAVTITRPVLYDGWRHFYFLTPFLVVIALTGLETLLAGPRLRWLGVAAAAAMLIQGVVIMVHYHPHENVYFNLLAGREVDKRFELDYWGLSFRQGLEYLLRENPRGKIPIHVSDVPGVVNLGILDKEERSRFEIVSLEQATYLLSNHRQPEAFADFRSGRFPCLHEVYAVRVAGATLLGVYKLR